MRKGYIVLIVVICAAVVGGAIALALLLNSSKTNPADELPAGSIAPDLDGIIIDITAQHESSASLAVKEARDVALEWAAIILNASLAKSYDGERFYAKVVFEKLSPTILGRTIPYVISQAHSGTTLLYTVANLSHLTKGASRDSDGSGSGRADWVVTFNANIDWDMSFPPDDENEAAFNLPTVAAHEFCHGLGLYTSVSEVSPGVIGFASGTPPALFDSRVVGFSDLSTTLATASNPDGVNAIARAGENAAGAKHANPPQHIPLSLRDKLNPHKGHSCDWKVEPGWRDRLTDLGNQLRANNTPPQMFVSGVAPTGYVDVFTPETFQSGSSVAHLPVGITYAHNALCYAYNLALKQPQLGSYDAQIMESIGFMSLLS